MTADHAFAAGWADGEHDAPMTPAETARMVALHARYLLADTA